ncbi:VOC family protein [Chelativorans sp. YIM 93263]|uniref:VOC family protein n=1 Tax=Chelativorans sp. YIM 93263 TaxID=2906648 RepID=UPI0023782BB7|nr:VOC family protein [Chelativorans sp. YIM 93263]
MQPAAILEAALYVSDLEEAERFYGEVLGLEHISKVDGRHVFFRCGNAVLLLFNPDATEVPPGPDARLPVPPHGARGDGHLCFSASAEDIEMWKTRLQTHNIKIEADFEWPKGGRSIYFRDPFGNSLEFAEPRIWGLD